ncbi:MAG: CpaF family protein [Actinobacteria bacterium]|nr:CpaF family protein [Actinomycetota bacterium]
MDSSNAELVAVQEDDPGTTMLERFRDLLGDESVEEVWLNSPDRIFAARNGRSFVTGIVLTCREIERFVAGLLLPSGRRLDALSPFVDASLPDGSRLHVVASGVAGAHLAVNIRKFPVTSWTLSDLVNKGACSPEEAAWLRQAIQGGHSILFSGATHTGKTTFLRACVSELPPLARVVVCEEVSELRPARLDSVCMQTRTTSLEGHGEISLRELVVQALRMRPDLLVVGEVRQAEAFDLLLALNCGIPGMGTIHADNATAALRKLATLALLAGSNVTPDFVVPTVASCVNVVVQLRRDPEGVRGIESISTVSLREGELTAIPVDLQSAHRAAA